MKTWKDFWITLALGIVLGMVIGWLVREVLTRRYEAELAAIEREIAITDSIHLAQIDSLYAALAASEATTDTIYVELIKWRTRFDTIIQNIPMMAPDAMLAEFDARTGPGDFSALIDSLPNAPGPMPYALIPMPRIEQALVLFTERDMLEGEVRMLTMVIKEHDGQITTLKAIIEQKDGQIAIRNAWIETIGNDRERIRRRLIITQFTAGAILLFLSTLLIAN